MKQTSTRQRISRLAACAALGWLVPGLAFAQAGPGADQTTNAPEEASDEQQPAGQDPAAGSAAQPVQPAPAPVPAPAPPPAPAPASPAAAAQPAGADEEPAQPAEVDLAGNEIPLETEEEVIVVTGSRIRTDPLDKPAPVLQLSREDIDRAGLTSVGDLLQRLPASGGGINSKFNSSGNFGFPPDGGGVGAGAVEAELRYLGSKRVLVLVDGVRWVNGSSASGVSSATDLNTIPIGIIDRIEVLEDGASALYGSDAIGGVINIITKRNVDGVFANVYAGGYNQGDGFTHQYDATWGGKNDKLSYVFSLSYVDQRRISSADRDLSRTPVPNVENCGAGCSAGTPQGRFVFTDPNTGMSHDLTINNNVGGIPRYSAENPGAGSDDFHSFETDDRFNFSPFNLMVTPSERIGAYSGIEYKLHPRATFFVRSLFTHRESVNQAAPEPIFIGPEAGNGNRLDTISVHETNPYNPFGFTLDARTNPYFIGRRPLEAGPRIFEQSVNTWYVAGGLRGDFKIADSQFFWDSAVVYSLNRADQLTRGGFNSAKLEKALGPVDECNADATCVPFNIFGGQGANGEGTITKEMLDYVGFLAKDLSEQQLFDVTANVSGDLFKLPAGYLSVAAGLEYRDQQGFYQPDAVTVAGDSAGVPSSPTSGSFTAIEGYAEVRVPILSKVQGANLLDLLGAVRISDYSTFGAHSTFKAGARWRPIPDLLVRGGYAQGFRAPGIGELFGSAARFDQTMTDPCSDLNGTVSGTPASDRTRQNCGELGVPTDGSYIQFNPQISVTTGGNRALDPETSNSIIASLVYSPSWLEKELWFVDNLDVEVTYYEIELEDAISAINAQDQIDLCVETLDPAFCQGIGRTPTGVINAFNNQLTNIGAIKTSGFDFSLSYLAPKLPAGRFRVTSVSNVLLRFHEYFPSTTEDLESDREGFRREKREGRELGDPERAFPRFKSSLIFDWFRNEWRASLTFRYIHSVTEQCRGLANFPGLCSDPDMDNDLESENRLSPTLYNDVQVTYTPRVLHDQLDVTIGVNNLFNQDPPACYSCALNGFDATTYDVPGLFGYIRAAYRMW